MTVSSGAAPDHVGPRAECPRARPAAGYAADDLPGLDGGITHDAGEAAHWPPFQAAAAQIIRARPDFDTEWGQVHPPRSSPSRRTASAWAADLAGVPRRQETQKIVAFTFGVAVHYITDETWEGLTDQLGRGQG